MKLIACAGCGTTNAAESTFCKICGYSIAGATVHDFTDAERKQIWNDLVSQFKQIKKELDQGKYRDPKILKHYSLLEAYFYRDWLRPLGSLWDSIVGQRLSEMVFPSPSLDLGCGDGTFTSIFLGTEYSKDFDISFGMSNQKIDMYDHYENGVFKENIIHSSERPFDLGIDIKETLVKKAMETGAYCEVRVDDGMELNTIKSNSIHSIWSNVIKNFVDINKCLLNVHRVLKSNGFIIAQLPIPAYLNNLYYYPKFLAEKNKKMKNLLWKMTRGEPDYHPRYLEPEQWRVLFEKQGFHNVTIEDYVINKHVLCLWDTGLRAFSKELRFFTKFLSSIGAVSFIKQMVVDRYIKGSIPILNYEKLSCDYSDFSFILLKAYK